VDEERKRILLALFPPAQQGGDEKTDTGWGLKYDAESLCYVPSRLESNKTDCAICLETMQSNCISSAKCNHVYHYNCLMEWMIQNHDQCPTCRAALWDEQAYQMLRSESSKAEENDSNNELPVTTAADSNTDSTNQHGWTEHHDDYRGEHGRGTHMALCGLLLLVIVGGGIVHRNW